MKKSKIIRDIFIYIALILLAIMILYPFVWMIFASFKSNNEIYVSPRLLPDKWLFGAFSEGWTRLGGKYSFGTFYLNSLKLCVPMSVFTVISSSIVAYGFARFKFPGRKMLFGVMIATMLLPDAIILVPRYLLFNSFGWVDTYKPFIIPTILASNSFYTYLLIQFFRGIPREIDESAKIDGCGSFKIFVYIMLPLCKASLISVAVFQFINAWNDFFNSMIYINSVWKYTVSLGLRLSIDVAQQMEWRLVLAMAVLAVIPGTVIYSFAQKYFTEGIVTTGIKG